MLLTEVNGQTTKRYRYFIKNPDHIQLPQISKCEHELNLRNFKSLKKINHYEKVNK